MISLVKFVTVIVTVSDCRLQTEGNMQIKGEIQTAGQGYNADCRLRTADLLSTFPLSSANRKQGYSG